MFLSPPSHHAFFALSECPPDERRYLGEWHSHDVHFEELDATAKRSSGQCYTVAAVYGVFMLWSMLAMCYNSYKKRV